MLLFLYTLYLDLFNPLFFKLFLYLWHQIMLYSFQIYIKSIMNNKQSNYLISNLQQLFRPINQYLQKIINNVAFFVGYEYLEILSAGIFILLGRRLSHRLKNHLYIFSPTKYQHFIYFVIIKNRQLSIQKSNSRELRAKMILLQFIFLIIVGCKEVIVFKPGEVLNAIKGEDNLCASYKDEIITFYDKLDGELVQIIMNPYNKRLDVYYILENHKEAHYYSISEITLSSIQNVIKKILITISSSYCKNIDVKSIDDIVVTCKQSERWIIYIYSIIQNKLSQFELRKLLNDTMINVYIIPHNQFIYLQGQQAIYKYDYGNNKIQQIYHLNCTIQVGQINRFFLTVACENYLYQINHQNYLSQIQVDFKHISQFNLISQKQYIIISEQILYICQDTCQIIEQDVDYFQNTNNVNQISYKKKSQITIRNYENIMIYPTTELTYFYYNYQQNLLIVYKQEWIKFIIKVRFPFYIMNHNCMIIKNDKQFEFYLLDTQRKIVRNPLIAFPKLNILYQQNAYQLKDYWLGSNLDYTIEQLNNQQTINISYSFQFLRKQYNYSGQGIFIQDQIVTLLNDQHFYMFYILQQNNFIIQNHHFEFKYKSDFLSFDSKRLILQLINNNTIQIYQYVNNSYGLVDNFQFNRIFVNSFVIIYEDGQQLLNIRENRIIKYQFQIKSFGQQIEKVYYDIYSQQIIILDKEKLNFFLYQMGVLQLDQINVGDQFVNCYFYQDNMIIVYESHIDKYHRIQNQQFLLIGQIDIQNNYITKQSIIVQEYQQYLYIQNGRQLLQIDILLGLQYGLKRTFEIQEGLQIIEAYQNYLWFQQGNYIISYTLVSHLDIHLTYLKSFHYVNLSLNICAQNIYDKQCEILSNRIQQSYFIHKNQNQIIKYNTNQISIPITYQGLVENIRIDKYMLKQAKKQITYKVTEIHDQILYGKINQDKLFIITQTSVIIYLIPKFTLVSEVKFNQISRYYSIMNETIMQFGIDQVQIVRCLQNKSRTQQFNKSIYSNLKSSDQLIVFSTNQHLDVYEYQQNEIVLIQQINATSITYDVYQKIIVYIDNNYILYVAQKSYNLLELFLINNVILDISKQFHIEIYILNSNIDFLIILSQGVFIFRFNDKCELKAKLQIQEYDQSIKIQVVQFDNLINVAVNLGKKFAIYQFSNQDIDDQKDIFPKKYIKLNQSLYFQKWHYGIDNNSQFLIYVCNSYIQSIEFSLDTLIQTELQFNNGILKLNLSNSHQFELMQIQLIEQQPYIDQIVESTMILQIFIPFFINYINFQKLQQQSFNRMKFCRLSNQQYSSHIQFLFINTHSKLQLIFMFIFYEMIILTFMLGYINGLLYQYSQPGIHLGAGELYRLDLLPKLEDFDYHPNSYYIDQINFHQYGYIIDLDKQFQQSRCITFIWILSQINSTIYVHQLQWENPKISSIIFQRTNTQLECYQIQILDQKLLLDCRENNIDCFYFVELNSQSYYKYNLQQVNYIGNRKCMVIKERKKVFIIRGNVIQAYSLDFSIRPQFLYQKIINFEKFDLEWRDHLSDIIYQVDNNYEVIMEHQFNNKIYTALYNKAINWNDQKVLQLCEPLLQNCKDLITIDNILDMQLNDPYLMVKAEHYIYIYHYNLKNSTKINFSGKTLFNQNLNQLMVIDDFKMILYQIDSQLLNFIKVQNGSLLIQQNHSKIITQFIQNDISMLIRKTKDIIYVTQTQYTQELRKNFPFIGGSLEYECDSKLLDLNIKYLVFYDELHCQSVFFINIFNNNYFYCLINDQLITYIRHSKGGFMQVQTKQINGLVMQIYSYDNKICMNIYTNKTQIICYQFQQADEQVIEYEQKGISFRYTYFLWLNDSNLYISNHHLVKIISIEKPSKIKHEQDLIIVFTQFYINVIIQERKIKFIELCSDFIDFLCLKYYCIQICITKIEKYALLQDNLLYCGEINLYRKVLNNKMKATSSSSDYFYLWDAFQLLIFSTHKALNQGFITALYYSNIQNVVALNDFLCIQFMENWKCYQQVILLEIKLDENMNDFTSSKLCASNYYDKQCVSLQIQYFKRNKNIKLKHQKMKIKINENQYQINLGHNFYIGNVDGLISDRLQIISRQQTIQKIYYQRLQQSLINWNFFIILTQDSLIFYNLFTHQFQLHHLNKICRQMIPIQNYLYLLCFGNQNLIFECLDECQFHSYYSQSQIQGVSNIKIYENQTIASAGQNKIIIFEWVNNTLKENIIIIPQYQYYDYAVKDQNLCILFIDMGNMIQFIRNNITSQFSIEEVFQPITDIKSLRIIQIQLIDSDGNAFLKANQNLYLFKFSIDKKPFYYGKIQYLNEKVQIRQFKDSYILMLSNYYQILIYKFKLHELSKEIYYQIFINLLPNNHQDNIIYISNNTIFLKCTQIDHIQLKEIKFDYLLQSEQPIQPQVLKLTLYNDEYQITQTIYIEFDSNEDLYFVLISCLLIVIFILIKKKDVQHQLFIGLLNFIELFQQFYNLILRIFLDLHEFHRF
ncbi:hypothetical protein pb186bvf_013676 [Paramecium bursaria]